jgi:hypothetical protein
MQGEKVGQTKTRTFNSLGRVKASSDEPQSTQFGHKLFIINGLNS